MKKTFIQILFYSMALSLSYYDIEQMAAIVLGDKIFVIRRNFR